MSDFKKLPKYKAGGIVSKAYEKRERKTEESADIAQDKAIVKKAFSMHDAQEHKGEKTDLSKLKKGGRAKKSKGTVRKYATGGVIESGLDAIKSAGKGLYENVMGTPEQNATAQANLDKQAKEGSKLAKFFGGKADAESAPVKKCSGGYMKKGKK